ncbi:MAG: hypothetical protein V3R81_03730 [Gammaproteobacteria bacterium]
MRMLVRATFLTIGILGCAIQAAASQVVELRRGSVASDGTQGISELGKPAFSPYGRIVTFTPAATNILLGAITNSLGQVFVYDRRCRGTHCQLQNTAITGDL